ncbi:unnamed protein product [Phytophthora lilii]|uniref:Unnamed protein product n=1 Tax=Phytophthora lilii TaxID=2077276 RepID=A0A9W6TPP7_9STRA|nr:unnamed protein product [Phytophthora lilii]
MHCKKTKGSPIATPTTNAAEEALLDLDENSTWGLEFNNYFHTLLEEETTLPVIEPTITAVSEAPTPQTTQPPVTVNVDLVVSNNPTSKPQIKKGVWSSDEHERYCAGLELYRYGSWKNIADYVGTRTETQVLSHAQSIGRRESCSEPLLKQSRTNSTKGHDILNYRRNNDPLTLPRKLSPKEPLIASMADTTGFTSNMDADASLSMSIAKPLTLAMNQDEWMEQSLTDRQRDVR